MADTSLSLSPTTNPLPWAVLATASYVSAAVSFDSEVGTPVLNTKDGKSVTDQDDMLGVLGSSIPGGDSTKASV